MNITNSTDINPYRDEYDEDLFRTIEFWMCGVVCTVLGAVGVVLNVISLMVWCGREMSSNTVLYVHDHHGRV